MNTNMQKPDYHRKETIFALMAFFAWTCCTSAKYSGGTGTNDNPYQIDSITDLLALATDINDYNKCFVLISDIDLDPNLPGGQVFTTSVIARDMDSSNWVFDGVSFTGIFDGSGHKILNLTINTDGAGNDYLALFGRIATDGVVKNLDLENAYIRGGNLSNCIGGLVGQNWGKSISNCSSIIDIAAGEQSSYLGGLAGDNGGSISGCLSMGKVAGGNYSYYIGGLAGDNYTSDINNCYSNTAVTAGINGYEFGGLVGRNEGSISKSFSTGAVAGGAGVARFGSPVGANKGVTTDCYFLLGSGPDTGSGTPLTDAQMKQPGNFHNWDFTGETANGYNDFWRLCSAGLEYPALWWEYLPGDIACPDGVDIWDVDKLCEQWLIVKMPIDLAPSGGDGIVNFADFAVFVKDWKVKYDIDDLVDFADKWLWVRPDRWPPADIWPLYDGDDKVNMNDLVVMCDYWLQ